MGAWGWVVAKVAWAGGGGSCRVGVGASAGERAAGRVMAGGRATVAGLAAVTGLAAERAA